MGTKRREFQGVAIEIEIIPASLRLSIGYPLSVFNNKLYSQRDERFRGRRKTQAGGRRKTNWKECPWRIGAVSESVEFEGPGGFFLTYPLSLLRYVSRRCRVGL